MKRTVKRFVAVLTMLCLLLGTMAIVSFAAEPENLLADGGFEDIGANGYKDWSSGWDLYWFPPECADDYDAAKKEAYIPKDAANAHSGEYYLMNDRTGWFGIAEPSVELAAGSYEFSAWVKALEGTLKVNVTVDQNDVPVIETDVLGTSVEIPEGEQWVKITCGFTIENAGTYRVRLGMNSIGQEVVEYHFDDFALVSVDSVAEAGKIVVGEAAAPSAPELGKEFLADGGFESIGANGYKDWSSGWDLYWFPPECADDYDAAKKEAYIPKDAANAHAGEYYLMNDRTGWFGIAEPSVELPAGSYQFTAWVKAVEGTLKVNVTVDQNDVPVIETDVLGTSVEIAEGNQWTKITCGFTIENAGTYRIRLGMNSIGQEVVEYHFDDFSLVSVESVAEAGKITVEAAAPEAPETTAPAAPETTAPSAPELGSEILADGGFESIGANGYKDWSSGWDLYWFPPECADDYDAAKKEAYIPKDAANAHSGEYYLMNDRTGWFGIAEPSVELAAGSYEFSAWVKAVEGTLKVNVTVDQNDVPVIETDVLGTSVEIAEGNQWTKITCGFTIENAGTYRVRLGMNSIGQEVVEYHFDDFSLVSVDSVAEAGKITVSVPDPSLPETGDSAVLAVALVLAATSCAALVVTTKSKKFF